MTARARSLSELEKSLTIEPIIRQTESGPRHLGWTAGGHVFGENMVCPCGTVFDDHQQGPRRKRCPITTRKVKNWKARLKRAAKRKAK